MAGNGLIDRDPSSPRWARSDLSPNRVPSSRRFSGRPDLLPGRNWPCHDRGETLANPSLASPRRSSSLNVDLKKQNGANANPSTEVREMGGSEEWEVESRGSGPVRSWPGRSLLIGQGVDPRVGGREIVRDLLGNGGHWEAVTGSLPGSEVSSRHEGSQRNRPPPGPEDPALGEAGRNVRARERSDGGRSRVTGCGRILKKTPSIGLTNRNDHRILATDMRTRTPESLPETSGLTDLDNRASPPSRT